LWIPRLVEKGSLAHSRTSPERRPREPFAFFFINVLVAMNAAAEARVLPWIDELRPRHCPGTFAPLGRRLWGGNYSAARDGISQAVRSWPRYHRGRPVLLAESARARTGSNLLIEVTDFRLDFANLIRRCATIAMTVLVAQGRSPCRPGRPTGICRPLISVDFPCLDPRHRNKQFS